MNLIDIPYEIAHRLGIPVNAVDFMPCPLARHAAGWVAGPSGDAGLALDGSYVTVNRRLNPHLHRDLPFYVAHEISHAVFWHPTDGVDVDETLMIPWEYATFRALGDLVAARAFMETSYTRDTAVTAHCMYVREWVRPREAAWWRRSVELCVELGVLDDAVTPTWQKPDWSRAPDWRKRLY